MRGDIKPILDKDGYAFMVGQIDGPHSMIWRIWSDRKSNVFLCPRPDPGRVHAVKVSLHTPTTRYPQGKRHEGFTSEFAKHNPDVLPTERHWREWEGDHFLSDRFRLAYRLMFPHAHLRPLPFSINVSRRIWCIDLPPPDIPFRYPCTILDIIFQNDEKSVSIENMPDELHCYDGLSGVLGSWKLRDNRRILLVNRVSDSPDFTGLAGPVRDGLLANAGPEALEQDYRLTLAINSPSIKACAELSWNELNS